MFTNGAVVSAASTHKDAAQKWITYLTSSDLMVQTRLTTSWELPPIGDESKLSAYLTAGSRPTATRSSTPRTRRSCRRSSPAKRRWDAINKELTAAAAHRKDVATALADAQAAVDKLLK